MSCLPRSRATVGGIALLTIALAASTQALPSIGSATRPNAVAAKAGTNGWKQLTTHKVTNIVKPDLLSLSNGGVQVVWTQDDSASRSSVRTRLVKESGAFGSSVATVVQNWAALIYDPQIINNAGKRLVAFSGIHSTAPGDPLGGGEMFYATSSNGTTWALGPGSLSKNQGAYGSNGTAAVDDSGTPIIGYTAGGGLLGSDITLHRGIDGSRPASSPDFGSSLTGCCSYDTGLARDSKSGTVWAAWYSNASNNKQNGTLVQKVYPTRGKLLLAPSSNVKGESLDPGQNVSIVSRNGGGVYVAYLVGWPTATKVAVWKVGTTQKIMIRAKGATHPMLAAGPHGKLWVGWVDPTRNRIRITRTNTAATRIGATLSVVPPSKGVASSIYALAGAGPTGPLHVVVNATVSITNEQLWYHKVLAGLTLVATPRTLNKGIVTAKVTDAGKPVAGARVRFGKASKLTNRLGIAKFRVRASYPSGKVRLKATKKGYTAGTAQVRVT